MLVFGQRSCVLGPRQLLVRKVNVLYCTLHSKGNLKCQKWPAVKNWTWILTFRRYLYRIWLHFKILATLQFLFKIRPTRWERFYAKFASTINSAQTKKTHSFELAKQIWKKLISVNTGFTNIPSRLAIFSHCAQRCAHLHAAPWLLSIFYEQGVETLIRFLGLLQKKKSFMYLCLSS